MSEPGSTLTSPNWSADGDPTKCLSIYMSKPILSCTTTHGKCSSAVNSLTPPQTMSKTVPNSSPHLPIQNYKTNYPHLPIQQTPTHSPRYVNKLGHNGLIFSATGETRARGTRMCAGRSLVNPALAHHHSTHMASSLDLEGGPTGADACGS